MALASCSAPLALAASPHKEARAVWLTRFDYCSVSSTHDQTAIQAYIAQVIELAANANFNIVFFQARGSADAYYTPGLEPWGELLTGTLGEDPGWDPLQFAIEEAHKRGLELHAWVNVFPAWKGPKGPTESIPAHALLTHPEWVVADSCGVAQALNPGYTLFSPGNPAVKSHILAVLIDIVTRYDIDGLHFDYIRYPDHAPASGYSHDLVSRARFSSTEGNPLALNWDDWQREQLTNFVAQAYNAVTALDPYIKVSAAVLGTYNGNGWSAYTAVYQDPRRWTELGKLDFITPMLYWRRSHPTQPFIKRSLEWVEQFALHGYVFPGIGAYRYTGIGEAPNWSEVDGQVAAIRAHKIPGMSFFEARALEAHWRDLRDQHFPSPANVPAMPWKQRQPLPAPTNVIATIHHNLLTVTWVTADTNDVAAYNIYAAPITPIKRPAARLLAIINGRLRYTRDLESDFRPEFVAVTSLDRAGNESGLSTTVLVELIP